MNPRKRRTCTMNKEQQCRTSKKNGKLLRDIFFNKQIPGGFCVCLLLSPCRTEVTILSTNQLTTREAQTCRDPFRRLSTPTEEYCETSTAPCGSVRVTPAFGGGYATRVAPLQTEPTRNAEVEMRHKGTKAIVPPIQAPGHILCSSHRQLKFH